MAIMTDNDIWNWIDRGTKPYRIYPRPGNRVGLIFRTGGRPKTIAGVFGSTLGSAPTSGIIRAKVVRHPGIKARRWSELGVRYYGVTATKLIVESLTNYLNQIWR